MTQDTYTKIIENALKLFAENGYDAASMNKIANESGVSKGDLYHHFNSKEELFIKTCEHAWMNMTVKELFKTEELTEENFKNEIVKRGKSYIQTIKHDPVRKKLAMALIPVMQRNDNISKQLMSTIDSVYVLVKNMIQKGIDVGAISPKVDQDLLTQEIFMILDAIEMYVAVDVEFDVEKIWEDLINKIL